jgi:hypothetical protein
MCPWCDYTRTPSRDCDATVVLCRALSCSVMPAGLEPIDSLVGGDSSSTASTVNYCGSDSWFSAYYWCFPSFSRPEVMKDRVVWTATALRPGTHTVSFNALAVTSGTSW